MTTTIRSMINQLEDVAKEMGDNTTMAFRRLNYRPGRGYTPEVFGAIEAKAASSPALYTGLTGPCCVVELL